MKNLKFELFRIAFFQKKFKYGKLGHFTSQDCGLKVIRIQSAVQQTF